MDRGIFYQAPWLFHLPCEFMLTQYQNLPSDLCYDLALVLGPAVLQNVLDDVVTILVLQEAVWRRCELQTNGLSTFKKISHRYRKEKN